MILVHYIADLVLSSIWKKLLKCVFLMRRHDDTLYSQKKRLLLITLSTFKACFLLPLCPWEWCPWFELRCGILNTQKTTEVLKISLLFFFFFRLNTLTLLYLLARTVALSRLKFVQKLLESYILNEQNKTKSLLLHK